MEDSGDVARNMSRRGGSWRLHLERSNGGAQMRQRPASLVLVHGAGSGPWVFSGWAEALPGIHTVAVDLHDGLDPSHASQDDYARAVVNAASDAPAPVALCGWSMGGLVVLQAASRTRPHSAVLVEASAPAEVQGVHPEVDVVDGTFDPEVVYGRFPDGMGARPESSRRA
jgi:pimeloyl-ACP methyl ester carboxylesterase